MQTVNGKIVKATVEELKQFYHQNKYDGIITFLVFLEYCRINGTEIIKTNEVKQ